MPRYSFFDNPMMLGFDNLEELVDQVVKSSGSGYPPYNIEQIGETKLRISLAVAGFSMDDLQITMEDRQLVIRGKQVDTQEDEERIFLHRGIASRQFQRNFILSDEIEVEEAHMSDGLLHIDLIRNLPEKNIQKIAIKPDKNAATQQNGNGQKLLMNSSAKNDKKECHDE